MVVIFVVVEKLRDALTGQFISQPMLKINATETARYNCSAENTHRDGHTSVSAVAFVTVIG